MREEIEPPSKLMVEFVSLPKDCVFKGGSIIKREDYSSLGEARIAQLLSSRMFLSER